MVHWDADEFESDHEVHGFLQRDNEPGFERYVPYDHYAASESCLEITIRQLIEQTKRVIVMRKFIERIANDELEEHGESLVCAAQDLMLEIVK
jgi:deoxyhypusine synthase